MKSTNSFCATKLKKPFALCLKLLLKKPFALCLIFLLSFISVKSFINDGDGGMSLKGTGTSYAKVRPSSNTIKLLEDDLIYQRRWSTPIVLSEFKLIFFTLEKVACTEWKLFFRSAMGYENSNEDGMMSLVEHLNSIHDPAKNGLTYLTDYSLEEAQFMLNSEEWTRAVFVREPKERILSAYLDKFRLVPEFFDAACCHKGLLNETGVLECRNKVHQPGGDFSYFLKRASQDCPNRHWNPQINNIDVKWWDAMTFVGYFDSLASHAQILFSSIYSSSSLTPGESAWELYGKSGWGPNGTSPFLVRDTTIHATNAHDKLRQYYTPRDEKLVEAHWAVEWEQTAYHFDSFHLFEEP